MEVEHDSAWHGDGWQRAWRLCDDSRGWIAEVPRREQHDWGPGTYDTTVTSDRAAAVYSCYSWLDSFRAEKPRTSG